MKNFLLSVKAKSIYSSFAVNIAAGFFLIAFTSTTSFELILRIAFAIVYLYLAILLK